MVCFFGVELLLVVTGVVNQAVVRIIISTKHLMRVSHLSSTHPLTLIRERGREGKWRERRSERAHRPTERDLGPLLYIPN